MQSTAAPTDNDAPPRYDPAFSEPDADTVLRSIEGTLYRVPAFVLRRTSGYFAATLPVTPDSSANNSNADAAIPIREPDAVLAHVLRLMCGLPAAPPPSFDAVEDVLALIERWDAPGPLSAVRSAITRPVLLAEPLRLYAAAVRFGWAEEARLAARLTLTLALHAGEHRDVLSRLPAKHLMELLGLHRGRRDALQGMLRGLPAGSVPGGNKVVCVACGTPADNYAWRELLARIFFEMDVRPLGDTVLGFAVDEWREAVACWNVKCLGEGCGKPVYDREVILRDIKTCMEKLPDTV
ncbi:hypothetical protein C8J57DRAFT_1628257 [Mycena rebaudengoi]|nr:hypothetical protein C8J57DRAFT_1628257 [Mycena rebaudengoi]